MHLSNGDIADYLEWPLITRITHFMHVVLPFVLTSNLTQSMRMTSHPRNRCGMAMWPIFAHTTLDLIYFCHGKVTIVKCGHQSRQQWTLHGHRCCALTRHLCSNSRLVCMLKTLGKWH